MQDHLTELVKCLIKNNRSFKKIKLWLLLGYKHNTNKIKKL